MNPLVINFIQNYNLNEQLENHVNYGWTSNKLFKVVKRWSEKLKCRKSRKLKDFAG